MNTICSISGQIILDPMTMTIVNGEQEEVLVCEASVLLARLKDNPRTWVHHQTDMPWEILDLVSENPAHQRVIKDILYTPLPSPPTPRAPKLKADMIVMTVSRKGKQEVLNYNAATLLEELRHTATRSWIDPNTHKTWDIDSLMCENTAYDGDIAYILARRFSSPPTPRRSKPNTGAAVTPAYQAEKNIKNGADEQNSPKTQSPKSRSSSSSSTK